jgi:hypothetical protein
MYNSIIQFKYKYFLSLGVVIVMVVIVVIIIIIIIIIHYIRYTYNTDNVIRNRKSLYYVLL